MIFRQLTWVSFVFADHYLQITEMTAGNYGYTLTLLVMPEAERRWRRRDDEDEPVEDSYDRFSAGGRVR